MNTNMFVTNQRSSYKVVQNGALALNKTISTTTIVGSSDAALALNADTEVVLVQVNTADVYVSFHGETPGATTSIIITAGSLVEMSRSQWTSAKWKRVSADATIVGIQLRAG